MLNLIAVLIFACATLLIVALYRRRTQPDTGREPGEGVAEPATESFMDRWERLALQAGLTWKRTLYYKAMLIGLALAAVLFPTGHWILATAAMLAGLLLPYAYVARLRSIRAALFVRQLPQALFLGASVLRGGGTLLNAVDALAQEMPDPMGGEFRQIQQQMRLQVPAHEAMQQAQARVGVREFAAVVVAARITTEVGGNLAHIFDEIARSILDAENSERTIKAFTTEGRMSANLIAALPFIVLSLMQLVSPDYFAPLLKDWTGRLVLIGCLGTILIGWRVIRRMIDIRMY